MALRLGKSVKECQRDIDSAEFSEWIAFNNIYPFIIDRSEYSTAILTSLTANINSKNKTFSPDDFLLNQSKKEQSPEEMYNSIKAAFNGGNQ